MPMYEHLPVEVTVMVRVDGHTLTFSETGKAKGGRYHGEDPAPDRTVGETLEAAIRGTVDALIDDAGRAAGIFLAHAYPVVSDPRRPEPAE